MGSHGIFDARMSVVGVLHGDVAAAVSDLGGVDGRNCRILGVVVVLAVLLILECGRSCLVEVLLLRRWELAWDRVISGLGHLALA